MNAKEILAEVRALEQKRAEQSGDKRLSQAEEAPFREWKVQRYTEAIALDPAFGDAYAERGSELYFLGRRPDAKQDMRKAYALGVSDPDQYMFMSMPFDGEEKREILRAGMAKVDRSAEETSWVYNHLYSALIRSYWYEGNFAENARLLGEWLPQLRPTDPMYRHSLHDLGMAYAALGRHAEAEVAYRKALAATPVDERSYVGDMVIRSLMHREDHAGARRALDELRSAFQPFAYAIFDAALAVLHKPGSAGARAASAAALAFAEEYGRRPGPTGKHTNYYSFLLGVIYRGLGRHQEAAEILQRFADESAANKKEWGVTMRWEIDKARELASMP
jgi:tetratricopeptide (TPR) repeat protein